MATISPECGAAGSKLRPSAPKGFPGAGMAFTVPKIRQVIKKQVNRGQGGTNAAGGRGGTSELTQQQRAVTEDREAMKAYREQVGIHIS